ncbi:response regulator transcription factor [Candidatus Roizmanbacteria bacterium]|nr:response regulator transcription factor [Candidatus Roizmanbacteria bacterium]
MRILVVEDEHKIANSIKKGLEQERYTVDVSYAGDSGFDLAVTEDYDLIILDILLPEMNGIEVCTELRKRSIHTPILMLTAKGQIHEKVEGFNAGADDYITKPFAFEELLARIKAITRRPKQTVVSVYTVDNLTVNPQTYQVMRGTSPISLSHKEYILLEYMVRHKNTVLSKEQIIQHSWDYEADILPNTVEVYIGYLRNKIDKPFPSQKPVIHTVRGFGYKISADP